ncbi:hypothetical protein Bhyg_03647 [Pseudolycoriella hygida]|uniref:Uncharacterized protein n=1 Tax=Pseudolycoriella hygida TaxID=35572 RepID=A0A9Q0NDS6_9DIPT|nr:hypothetical protein Bhyg_03647 [Pseudolycoriella hygida]
MKLVFVLCSIFSIALAAPRSSGLPCLKDTVMGIVGSDPNYQRWYNNVDQSVTNLYTLMAQCASLPLNMQPFCYNNVVEIGTAWYNNAVKDLSNIDVTKQKLGTNNPGV